MKIIMNNLMKYSKICLYGAQDHENIFLITRVSYNTYSEKVNVEHYNT